MPLLTAASSSGVGGVKIAYTFLGVFSVVERDHALFADKGILSILSTLPPSNDISASSKVVFTTGSVANTFVFTFTDSFQISHDDVGMFFSIFL